MRTHPLLRALLGLALGAPMTVARAQPLPSAQAVTLRLRPDTTTVGIGQRVPFAAFVVDAAGRERETDSVTLATRCGRVEGRLVFIATRPGRCTVTASHRTPDGPVVRATAVVVVREPQHAGRPSREPPPTPVGGEPASPTLPQFPWPVPHATAQTPIPRGLITAPHPGTGDRLGDVADSIETALDRAQLEYAVYAIGDSGFAYVTRVEQIRPTGEPLPVPNRFPNGMRGTGGTTGFLDFLASRFRARPGLFRVMAIVVTSRPLERSATGLARDSALALVRGGMVTLPAALRARVVTELACAAFVYEFETARASDSTAVLREAPRVPARRHLVAAGLWTAAQLGVER